MEYYSDILGEVYCLPDQVGEIKKLTKKLFYQFDTGKPEDGKIRLSMRGCGKFYGKDTLPTYKELAAMNISGNFYRHGEQPDDIEKIEISDQKVTRFFLNFDIFSVKQVAEGLKPLLANPDKALEEARDLLGRLTIMEEFSATPTAA